VNCDLSAPNATCPRCGFVSKIRGGIRQCTVPVPETCGPGCQLRRSLAWLGIRDDGSCGCDSFAAKMDAWGQGCWDHMEEIVEHLREAAATKGLPFIATAARILIARAIEAARKETADATQAEAEAHVARPGSG